MNRLIKIALAAGSAIAALPLAAKAFGRRYFNEKVSSELRVMLAAGIDNDADVVTEEDIARMPESVKRYLRYAGVVGRERIRTARVREQGVIQMAAGPDKVPFQAQEYFTVFPASFMWIGRISISSWFAMDTREAYWSGHAETLAKVEGFYTVIDDRGPENNLSGLVRYLCGMVLFPTAFVDDVRWEAIDEASARLFFEDDGMEASAVCTFGPDGELLGFLADRPRRSDGGFVPGRWSVLFSDYVEIEGMMLPTESRARWLIDGEEEEYVFIEFTDVEYDIGPDAIQ